MDLPNVLKSSNYLNFIKIRGGGGGSRTYSGSYSHKGLQRFTECLPNFEAYLPKSELSLTESDSNIPLLTFSLTWRMAMIKIPTEFNLYRYFYHGLTKHKYIRVSIR